MAQNSSSLSLEGASHAGMDARDQSRWFGFAGDQRGRLSRFASRLLLGFAVLLLLAAGALYGVRASYSDRVYPSVVVADVDLGGMSFTEARSAIDQRAAEIASTTITLSYDGETWNPSLGELGVVVDTDASLEAAFNVGREADARDRVNSALGLIRSDKAVPLQLRLDETTFSAWMDAIDRDLGAPAKDARLVIEEGKVSVEPDVAGTIVDRAAARGIVLDSMRTLAPFDGSLPVEPAQAMIHTEDLDAARGQLEKALSKPIKLVSGKKKWTLTPTDMGQFVVQNVSSGSTGAPTVSISVDREALADYLNALLKDEVNREPKNARIAWDVEKKAVFAVEKSVNGAKLKPLTLADEVTASFFGKNKGVKIPTTTVKPDVDSNNLKALGITNRIAVGDSNFDGSDGGRATNIVVGASLLNGTLVPPKSDFSFNHAIGEITEEKGYVESLVVAGERIDRDIGGGICQVSTTVFRAAFFGGLPITEWHPHRYRLGFYELDGYPPGLDASILQPEGDPFGGGDFQFSNPTDSWLLIESYVDGPRVYVIIYGPELGWDVRISDAWYGPEVPKGEDVEVIDYELPAGTIQQTEYPQEGLEVFFQRTVFDAKGKLLWDRTFGTYFYPRGNVYKVSPDMAGQSPAASS